MLASFAKALGTHFSYDKLLEEEMNFCNLTIDCLTLGSQIIFLPLLLSVLPCHAGYNSIAQEDPGFQAGEGTG